MKIAITYTLPKVEHEPIMVNCVHPNGAIERIGSIFQDHSSDEATYYASDKNGETLCPPSIEWSTIEKQFEQYAQTLIQKERENELIHLAERQNKLREIRQRKEFEKTQNISNLISITS